MPPPFGIGRRRAKPQFWIYCQSRQPICLASVSVIWDHPASHESTHARWERELRSRGRRTTHTHHCCIVHHCYATGCCDLSKGVKPGDAYHSPLWPVSPAARFSQNSHASLVPRTKVAGNLHALVPTSPPLTRRLGIRPLAGQPAYTQSLRLVKRKLRLNLWLQTPH